MNQINPESRNKVIFHEKMNILFNDKKINPFTPKKGVSPLKNSCNFFEMKKSIQTSKNTEKNIDIDFRDVRKSSCYTPSIITFQQQENPPLKNLFDNMETTTSIPL